MDAVASSFELCQQLLAGERRLLVCGSPGSDRRTPVIQLIQALAAAGADYPCLTGDPALPLFGVPGALNFGYWKTDAWQLQDCEALCSLDSSRFRLPLVTGLNRLLERNAGRRLILQAPGLARGVAGAELLAELVRCGRIDIVVLLSHRGSTVPLPQELQACGADVVTLSDPADRSLGKQQRREQRSQMWRNYLAASVDVSLPLAELQILGTPPPTEATDAWKGRQIALLYNGNLASMGQVLCLQGDQLQARVAAKHRAINQLLLRDALCIDGQLQSAKPYRKPPENPPQPPAAGFLPEDAALTKVASCGPIPVARCGSATACLINGVFGDPLLKLQLHHQRRSLLFDLGDPGRMTAPAPTGEPGYRRTQRW